MEHTQLCCMNYKHMEYSPIQRLTLTYAKYQIWQMNIARTISRTRPIRQNSYEKQTNKLQDKAKLYVETVSKIIQRNIM